VAESDLRAYADRVQTFFDRWLLNETADGRRPPSDTADHLPV
jgi:hypothetical protein